MPYPSPKAQAIVGWLTRHSGGVDFFASADDYAFVDEVVASHTARFALPMILATLPVEWRETGLGDKERWVAARCRVWTDRGQLELGPSAIPSLRECWNLEPATTVPYALVPRGTEILRNVDPDLDWTVIDALSGSPTAGTEATADVLPMRDSERRNLWLIIAAVREMKRLSPGKRGEVAEIVRFLEERGATVDDETVRRAIRNAEKALREADPKSS